MDIYVRSINFKDNFRMSTAAVAGAKTSPTGGSAACSTTAPLGSCTKLLTKRGKALCEEVIQTLRPIKL